MRAIDEGHLALLTAPPLLSVERGNSREGWLRNNWAHRPVDARSTLQFCTNALNSKYANMQKKEVASAIKTEISNDLCCMRQQPVLMGEYRRYVIFSTAKERRVRRDDGVSLSKMPVHIYPLTSFFSWSGQPRGSLTLKTTISWNEQKALRIESVS